MTKQKLTYKTLCINDKVTKNNNGRRIIDFGVQNDLLVFNILFTHRDIHEYSRVDKSWNEKSVTVYVLIKENHRKDTQDVIVRRRPEINNNHYIVIGRTQIGFQNIRNDKGTKKRRRRKH